MEHVCCDCVNCYHMENHYRDYDIVFYHREHLHCPV